MSTKSLRILSEESKLSARIISGFPASLRIVGWSAEIPKKLAITLIDTTTAIHQMKINTGSGSLFPDLSIQFSNPCVEEGCALLVIYFCCLHCELTIA